MAVLAVDSSSPAVKLSSYLGSTPETQASNSFSPSSSTIITVVSWAADSFDNDWNAAYPTITDSLTSHLTWNPAEIEYSNSLSSTSARIGLWWASVGGTAPGSMTASVTEAATGGQYIQGMAVSARVWDNANASNPIGAVVAGTTSAATTTGTISITPTSVGSAIMMAASNVVGGPGTNTVGSGCYLCDNAGTATNTLGAGQLWVGTSSGPVLTTSLIAQSVSMTNTTSHIWTYLAYEVLPASGGSPVTSVPVLLFQEAL